MTTPMAPATPLPTDAPVVQPGSFLTLHYRLAGPAGDVINTFDGKPATLSLGVRALTRSLKNLLLGLLEGAHTTFHVPAGEAFGERNPEMVQWVARRLLNELGDPHEHTPRAMWCNSPTPDGSGTWPPVWRCAGAEGAVQFDLQPPAGGPPVSV